MGIRNIKIKILWRQISRKKEHYTDIYSYWRMWALARERDREREKKGREWVQKTV